MNQKLISTLLRVSPYLGAFAIIVGFFVAYNNLDNVRQQWKDNYNNLVSELEFVKQQHENKLKLANELSKLRLTQTKEEYEAINAKLRKQLKDKNIIINGLTNDTEQLQNSLRAALIRQSESTSNTVTTTKGLRDANAACTRDFEQLRLSCGITTNQYNLLRSWADETCTIVDCSY